MRDELIDLMLACSQNDFHEASEGGDEPNTRL